MDDFATGYMAGQDSGSGNGGFGGWGDGIWAVIILAILFGTATALQGIAMLSAMRLGPVSYTMMFASFSTVKRQGNSMV